MSPVQDFKANRRTENGRSAQEVNLTVIAVQAQRLKPPPFLKKEERVIFEHVVNHSAPMHFIESKCRPSEGVSAVGRAALGLIVILGKHLGAM